MTKDTQSQKDNTNEKPEIKKVQYNIDGLEQNFKAPELPQDAEDKHDFEQEYKDFGDKPRVRIIFKNGAMLQIRMTDGDMPVEETFKADDPHSVWAGGHELNGFSYSHCENAEDKVIFAAQADIDEYQRDYRETEEDFSDWETVQEVIF